MLHVEWLRSRRISRKYFKEYNQRFDQYESKRDRDKCRKIRLFFTLETEKNISQKKRVFTHRAKFYIYSVVELNLLHVHLESNDGKK